MEVHNMTTASKRDEVLEQLHQLSASNLDAKHTAQGTLLRMGEEAFEILQECINNPNPETRYNALSSIGDMLNNHHSYAKRAIPRIREMAQEDDDPHVARHDRQILHIARLAGVDTHEE